MTAVVFSLIEKHGKAQIDVPFQVGVPFPKGEVTTSDKFLVEVEGEPPKRAQMRPISFWNGGSVRWANLNYQRTIGALETVECLLRKTSNEESPSQSKITFKEIEAGYVIDTGSAKFIFGDSKLFPSDVIIEGKGKQTFKSRSLVRRPNELPLTYTVDTVTKVDIEPLYKQTIIQEGRFFDKKGRDILFFDNELTFFINKNYFQWSFRILNRNAASHEGGYWDLGDPGSVYLQECSFEIEFAAKANLTWCDRSVGGWHRESASEWGIVQLSSNAVCKVIDEFDRKNINPSEALLKEQTLGPISRDCPVERADPVVIVNDTAGVDLFFYLDYFWQKFPSSVVFKNDALVFGLYPRESSELLELQAGESKTESGIIGFDLTSQEDPTQYSRIAITIDRKFYCEANAMPWLSELHCATELESLVECGIEGPSSFFSKRENSNEFGWRNFGETWADHETMEHGNDETLVSHYNNQYDLVYGFAYQYLISGDNKWFYLMDELANHVVDIDIYKTDKDRLEFNNGLFWHTDHYMDASTATHRTFSKNHVNVNHVAQSGGGPGSEHCYSSGLTFHFFLTGSQRSRVAALQMTQWMINVMEGSGTLLERIKSFLRKDIGKISRLFRGEGIFDFKYPFTRATGNYINTLLDSFLITSDAEYLIRAEAVIENTISPTDPIKFRHLDDVEVNWSYTMLLQAIARYLSIKADEEQFDDAFMFARDSYLHYADWMLNNESIYLMQPDKLEYPNSTWAAQEIRKSFVLIVAAQLVGNGSKFLDEANKYLAYLLEYFDNDSVLKSTRIQAILLQSYGPHDKTSNKIIVPKTILDDQSRSYKDRDLLSIRKVMSYFFRDVFLALSRFSLAKEIAWLKFRLK